MANFTFFDFQELTNNEKNLNKLLQKEEKKESKFQPKKSSLNNILAYSKALSIRKTSDGNTIENILN